MRSRLPLLLIASLAALSPAQAATPQEALAGHWRGTLEYRDYSNDKRVQLPTTLDVSPTSDPAQLEFRYVYDDGPGKTVRETERVAIDLAAKRYDVIDDKSTDRYRIVDRRGFDQDGDGRLLLLGNGIENDKGVTIRTSITRYGDRLSILRESQLPGEPFKFRHIYRFTRDAPATH